MNKQKQCIARAQSRMPGRRWTMPALAAVTLLAGAGLLGGCGGGGSDGTDGGGGSVIVPPPSPPPVTPPPAPVPLEMVLDEVYEVDSGTRLVNRSATPAHIEVRHDVIDGRRLVVLREGAADLHR